MQWPLSRCLSKACIVSRQATNPIVWLLMHDVQLSTPSLAQLHRSENSRPTAAWEFISFEADQLHQYQGGHETPACSQENEMVQLQTALKGMRAQAMAMEAGAARAEQEQYISDAAAALVLDSFTVCILTAALQDDLRSHSIAQVNSVSYSRLSGMFGRMSAMSAQPDGQSQLGVSCFPSHASNLSGLTSLPAVEPARIHFSGTEVAFLLT